MKVRRRQPARTRTALLPSCPAHLGPALLVLPLLVVAALLAGCGTPAGPAPADLTGGEQWTRPPIHASASPGPAPETGSVAGRRFLWVQSKGVYCGVQCYEADGAFRPLLDRYRSRGAVVDVTTADPIRDSDLAGYDLVWIALPSNWYGSFSEEEAQAVRRHVEAGGGLQILSDGLLSPNANLDAVADVFGLEVGVGEADYFAETVHPTFGERVVVTAGAGAVGGGDDWAVDGFVEVPVGVLSGEGAGRVLLLGDANAFTGTGLRMPGGDNAEVSDIAVDWLLGFDRYQVAAAPDPSI